MNSRKVWIFAFCQLAVGSVLAFVAATQVPSPAEQPYRLHWIILAGAFLLTESFTVDLDVRRQAQSLTFTEAPLMLGLVLAAPIDLVVVRIGVGVVTLVLIRRSAPVKVLFNAGMFAVQVALALFIFHAVLGTEMAVEPLGWLAGLLAAGVSYSVTALAVTFVMWLAGAEVSLRSQALVVSVGLCAALAGSAAALGAAAALWRDGRAWILLALMTIAIGYFGPAYLKIRDRHRALADLNAYTSSLGGLSQLGDLARAVVSGTAELLHASRAVLLVPGENGILRLEHVDGELVHERLESIPAGSWESAVAMVDAQNGRWTMGPSIAGVPLRDSDVLAKSIALLHGSGLIVLDGRLSNARVFDDEDLQLLDTASVHAASALYNVQLMEHLREEATFRARQALHDEVTDLPNSRGLAETLQRPLLAGAQLSILTIRIDSLREVNETLGRAMGDELLQQAAARLSPLTESGWCAKTATDEFTLVVRGGSDEAEAMAERVIQSFDAPVQCADVALAITAGIGIVLAPDHGRETEILLRRASLAASRARVEGSKVTTWAADRDPYDPQRLAIAADLRDAIPAGELQVHFQPQVDIDSGLVTGAEALVRWRHPRLGELRPDQFIAAAEYTGAIDALTEFVLSSAARTCATWREQGWDLDVSVNLSARNLANAAFADLVAGILDDTGLEASALTLELTESSIMTEAEGAMRTLAAIHDLGVSLSIDDFGTGYSSLAHLRKLPVSEIKIDKSFVFDLTTSHSDEAIVRSMIDLGHHLGLTVVIEGVETVEVRRRLAEMGADRIQGYLLSRPMPVAAFEQWIADRPVRMAELSTSDAEADAPDRIEDRER
jgi:diguanylate cyclase (GGDEF)-like protein